MGGGAADPSSPVEVGEAYRVLFEHAGRMVCTLDLEGRFTAVNRAGEELTGYRSEELVGTFAAELIAPELREEAVQQFRSRLAGTGGPDESVLVTRDGKRVPIDVTSAVLSREGRPVAVLGIVGDLTERKHAESALDQSEERFRALLEAAPDAMVVVDESGEMVVVNAQTELLFGYSRDELIGRPVEMLMPEHLRGAHAGHRRSYSADRRVRPMGAGLELHGLHGDGHEIPIEISLSPLDTPVGVLVVAAIRDVTDRMRTEAALREAEARFRSFFEHAPIGDVIFGSDGRYVEVNDAFCELVGYSREELQELTWRELTHPDDLERDVELVLKLLQGDVETYQIEKRYVHRLGHSVWALLTASLFHGAEGEPLHFVSQVVDVTERRLAQEAVAESAARLAEAQRLAHVGSWEWRVEENVLAWSDELYRILAIDPGSGELSYERYLERIHPDDRTRFESVVSKTFEAGGSYAHEYRVVLPDGTTRWIQGRGQIEIGPEGPARLRGTAQDITERKEAEQRLVDAELRYRTLVERLPLATYIRPLDMSRPNVYASPQVEQMLGYSAEEWQGNPRLLAEIVHPDDRQRVLAEAARVRSTGEPFRGEYRYIARDGRVVWVQDETYVVQDEHGEPCVQGYLLDITERKQAEEERDRLRDELHHSQKLDAIGQLAGGVAHDFNNMLTAIKGYSELLLDGLEPGSPLRAEAEQIRRAADQASGMTSQLLAFSRKQPSQPKLIDLNEVVSAASDLLRRLVGGAVELVADARAQVAGVLADPTQIEQVLLNLAVNARDAMPAGGTLRITTQNVEIGEERAAEHEAVAGSYVVISVADTGQGMDASTKERVFEPFFTTKGPGQGSGLGLATVYGIVKQSSGFVRVESEPHAGSVFEVYLPCATAGPSPNGLPADQLGAPGGQNGSVLLVEDEEIVRDLARTVLERAGYSVRAAVNGADALALCAQATTEIDLLVTDMVMPGMGGRELAERVLALRPGAGVVLMSGYTEEAPVVEIAEGVAAGFLQKPFAPGALVRVAREGVRHAAGNGHTDCAPALKPVTCVVADDHPAVLDSVSRFLEGQGMEVMARVADGDAALREIMARRPALALLDVGMTPTSGIDVARQVAQAAPGTRIVLYTGSREQGLLERALEAGARGFVLKEAPLSELARALGVVADGGTYVDPELSGAVVSAGTSSALAPLTKREREVLSLLADGMTNERAATALGVAAETIQSHVRNAMAKLDADTRTEAVATAIRQGPDRLERRPDLELPAGAADHLVRELARRGVAAQVGGTRSFRDGFEAGLADRPRGLVATGEVGEQGGGGEDHRHRVRHVLAPERRCRPVGSLGEHDAGHVVVPERDDERLGACDRSEEGQDEVGEDVAVAVERRDHERIAARREQQGEGGVNQLRLVDDVRMTRGRCVHLLLEHALVDRADGVLRAPEHAGAGALGEPERELGHRVADPPLDALRPERGLVLAVALAPLLRAVGVADGHAHDRDRRVDAAERRNAGDAPAGADDHATADLLPQDPVRRADVARLLGRDRRRLEPEAVLADGGGGLVDDAVPGRAPVLERQVEARKLELDPDHVGGEDAQRLLQQLLAGLVPFQDDDRLPVHSARFYVGARGRKGTSKSGRNGSGRLDAAFL